MTDADPVTDATDNVVEMKRKIAVSVNRFGQVFSIEYRAGVSPKSSDPQAALYVNGAFLAWAPVVFHDPADWSEVSLDIADAHTLLSYSMLGMPSGGGDLADTRFISEAEEYVMNLLRDGLAKRLTDTPPEAGAPEEEQEEPTLSPYDRGRRAVAVWHNHGKNEEQLPELIAIEIFDALDEMGVGLGAMLDEEKIPRKRCGSAVREVVAEALSGWHAEQFDG